MAQLQGLKRALGQGQNPSSGKASSNYGLGTSPYAAEPAPADPNNQVKDRQGDEGNQDIGATDFEPVYGSEEFAHGFGQEDHLQGRMDLTQAPKKIEEVRSAPETQEAITEYVDVIGSYNEGEESAMDLETVPLEYQDLVKGYFDRLNEDAASAGDGGTASAAGEGDGSGEGGDTKDGGTGE